MKKELRSSFIAFGIICLFLSGAYFWSMYKKNDQPKLPFYGKKLMIPANEYQKQLDYLIPRIGKFAFMNQDGDSINEKKFEGSIFVANYIFTTCPGICKDMTRELRRVYKQFQNDSTVKILSHTSKPEEDSVAVLKAFAERNGVSNGKQWMFVTGNIDSLYKMAAEEYLIVNPEDEKSQGTFVHTERVALIDGKRRIRGYYDATDSKSIDKMISDIILLKEEQSKN